jgi:hypothetical protein
MTDDVLSNSVWRDPDAQLHTAMRCDVEAAGGRRQVQLPLQLQIASYDAPAAASGERRATTFGHGLSFSSCRRIGSR